MIQAVVFDFEGTLVDFQWQLAAAEAELRPAFAVLGHTVAGNYAQMWNAAVERAPTPAAVLALRAAIGPVYDRWDADALTRWAPRAGARALLQQLAERGVRAAMVSNIGRSALAAGLVRCGLGHGLAPVLSRDDVVWMKPHPQGVRAVLAMLGCTPAHALFVGDSLADVAAARAAGMPVAIVRDGECGEAAFATAPPDHLLPDVAAVTALVNAG